MSTVHWHYSYSIDSYICVRYAMMFNCFSVLFFLFSTNTTQESILL